MNVSILWTGYVWLIQATWLAKLGFKITALDVSEDKINKLKSGIPTIFENWLNDLLKETLPNINFTPNINELKWSDIICSHKSHRSLSRTAHFLWIIAKCLNIRRLAFFKRKNSWNHTNQ